MKEEKEIGKKTKEMVGWGGCRQMVVAGVYSCLQLQWYVNIFKGKQVQSKKKNRNIFRQKLENKGKRKIDMNLQKVVA